jgi:hypothetical protein
MVILSKKIKIFIAIYLIINVLFIFFYFSLAHSSIRLAYQNQAPFWLELWIDTFYPRFWTEKNRFSLDFFIQKVDSLWIRFLLANILLSVLFFFTFLYQKTQLQIKKYFSQPKNQKFIHFLKIWLALVMLFVAHDWIISFYYLSKWSIFYQPVFLLKILGKEILPFYVLFFLWFVWLISTIFLIFSQKYEFILSIIAGTLFIFLQGFLYSFHKIDHPFVLLNFMLFLLPFQLKSKENWALKMMQITMASAYFLAGIEKILVGGNSWFFPENIRIHIQNHEVTLGMWLAQFDIFCILIGLFAIAFELIFPIILFTQKFKKHILFIGILFHLGNYFLLGVGHYLHPWILLYIIWLEDEKFFQ